MNDSLKFLKTSSLLPEGRYNYEMGEAERERKGKQDLLSTATSLEPFAEDCCLPWLWCSASTVALLDRIVMFSLISLSMKEDQEFGNFKGLDSKLKFFY